MEGQAEIIAGKVGQVLHLDAKDRLEVLHHKGLDLITRGQLILGFMQTKRR